MIIIIPFPKQYPTAIEGWRLHSVVRSLWKTLAAYPPNVFSYEDFVVNFCTFLMEPFIASVTLGHSQSSRPLCPIRTKEGGMNSRYQVSTIIECRHYRDSGLWKGLWGEVHPEAYKNNSERHKINCNTQKLFLDIDFYLIV